MSYYVMHKDFAAPLWSRFPDAATYDDETLILTGEMPKDFSGEIININEMELTMDELSDLVDLLRVEEHTGKLVVITKEQGTWLCANHSAFMTEDNTR